MHVWLHWSYPVTIDLSFDAALELSSNQTCQQVYATKSLIIAPISLDGLHQHNHLQKWQRAYIGARPVAESGTSFSRWKALHLVPRLNPKLLKAHFAPIKWTVIQQSSARAKIKAELSPLTNFQTSIKIPNVNGTCQSMLLKPYISASEPVLVQCGSRKPWLSSYCPSQEHIAKDNSRTLVRALFDSRLSVENCLSVVPIHLTYNLPTIL